jgi:hypothetical protein
MPRSLKHLDFDKPIYLCIHCSWIGHDFVLEGKHEMCPKCDWVAYDEEESRDVHPYKKLYKKVERLDKERKRRGIL